MDKAKKLTGNKHGGYTSNFSKTGSNRREDSTKPDFQREVGVPFHQQLNGKKQAESALVRNSIPKFTMLVGLPGSGKTYYAESIKGRNIVWLQSHVYSENFYHNQNRNRKAAFKAMIKTTVKMLKKGKSVIYDATNVVLEDRLQVLQEIEGIACEKICVIFATAVEQCVEWDALTETPASEKAIRRMMLKWCTPCLDEGWDKVVLNRTSKKGMLTVQDLRAVCKEKVTEIPSFGFQQVGSLVNLALDYADSEFTVQLGVFMHYVGLLNAKQREKEDGIVYSHASNVAAYYSLLLDVPMNPLKLSAVLSYHNVGSLSESRKKFVDSMEDGYVKKRIYRIYNAMEGVKRTLIDGGSMEASSDYRSVLNGIRSSSVFKQFTIISNSKEKNLPKK